LAADSRLLAVVRVDINGDFRGILLSLKGVSCLECVRDMTK
jgi:hypothetical protein